MAVINIYAGSSTPLTKLPSPVSVQVSREQVWDEKTGRNASGTMIGTSVAGKYTYNIKWGILTAAQLSTITTNMPREFFYFGIGTSAPVSPDKYYRSEIVYDIIQADATYYKDVTVSVIQK